MLDISFIESKLLDLSFQSEDDLDDQVNIQHSSGYSKEDAKKFLIRFDIKITSKQGYSLSFMYAGFFECGSIITDEFKSSDFVKVNAPAITYPFVRSFLSNFTINSGLTPIVLPVINFQALAKKTS